MGPLGVVEVHPLADDPFDLETIRQFVQVSLVTNIGVCPDRSASQTVVFFELAARLALNQGAAEVSLRG
jgi:hypothetical protein